MEKEANSSLPFMAAVVVLACLLLTDWWAVSGLIVLLAILYGAKLTWKYGQTWQQKRHCKAAQKERFFLFLVSLMILFLGTGTALFLWAFHTIGSEDSSHRFVNAEYLFRSLVCSFQLFTANIDSNVVDAVGSHKYIKGLISVQAVLSFACTLAVLISLAYVRMKAYLKLHRQTKISNDHNHLYVFFGMNEPSRLLAKSIRDKEKDRALIVFVENSQMDDDDKSGWNNIVGLFTHRRQTFSEAEDLNARVTFTETKLCDVEVGTNGTSTTDVLDEINLLKLKELIHELYRENAVVLPNRRLRCDNCRSEEYVRPLRPVSQHPGAVLSARRRLGRYGIHKLEHQGRYEIRDEYNPL